MRRARTLAACVWLSGAAGFAGADSTALLWQSVESVKRAAEAYAMEQVSQGRGASIEAVGIDERLRLPACSQSLDTASHGTFANGRGTVIVRCAGDRPWHLFVPVRVAHHVGVVVARRMIHRDEVLSEADIEVAERRAATLPYQYVTRLEDAVGATLRRSLSAGAVLVPSAVERPSVIERGAKVTLVAGKGSIVVKAEGIALEAAGLNESVRVRTAVGRVVQGRAEARDLVRVGP